MPTQRPAPSRGGPPSGRSHQGRGRARGCCGNSGDRPQRPKVSDFTGNCIELQGHMFDCSDYKQADAFVSALSSAETELVPADDFMPILLWTNYFLEAQGHGHQDTVLHQDNQSAVLLENNGRKSSSKRTKHLDCRFYFITDRISNNELSVEHCPTEEMIGNFFTKPPSRQTFLQVSPTHYESARVIMLIHCHQHFASQECVGEPTIHIQFIHDSVFQNSFVN
jgi:hypothetical protein